MSGDSAVTRCNSDPCLRRTQDQEALACLERALEIVDRLGSCSASGARIQHAIDTLISEVEIGTDKRDGQVD